MVYFITGPFTHGGGSIVLLVGVCRRLSSAVVCNTPWRRNVTHKGAARDGWPVGRHLVVINFASVRVLLIKNLLLVLLYLM